MSYPIVAILGPTGSGKSDLALALAERFRGEIVNCDSLQVYRGLDIGTAKTPPEERRGVPHHLFDIVDPQETFSAAAYADLARPLLTEICGRARLPFIVGGTGFYFRTLFEGLSPGPQRDERLRQELERREVRRNGLLHRYLRRFDPPSASRIHPNDKQKIVRCVEICRLQRRPASVVLGHPRVPLQGFRVLKLGLAPRREILYSHIEQRAARMFQNGIVQEVADLLRAGVPLDAKAFESLGYKEAIAVLQGKLALNEAVERTARETRQYAKRQMTWFRKEQGMVWLSGFGNENSVLEHAISLVTEHSKKQSTN